VPAGYGAYGSSVADDVLVPRPRPAKTWIAIANLMVWLHVLASYQVFSHPVFEVVERQLLKVMPSLQSRQLWLRIVWRSVYVLLTAIVAASLPFFGDLMGLIGAGGFIPMTFIMPCVLWLISTRSDARPQWERSLNYVIITVYTLVGILSFIGSVASIAHKSSTYEFWQ
jgi:amino acid permease